MKVLFWAEHFYPYVGGIETFGEQLMLRLQKKGFEFGVVTSLMSNCPEFEEWQGIKIHRFPLRPGFEGNILAFKKSLEGIRRVKESFQPQLTHLNTSGPSFFYHYQTRQVGPHPTLFTFHCYAPNRNKENSMFDKMLGQCDWISSVAKDPLESYLKNYPEFRPRSSVIYNGLKDPEQAPSPLSFDPPSLVSLGRLVREKGLDLSIRAFAHLRKEFPQLSYQIIGTGSEEPSLKVLAQELNLGSSIQFLGYLSDREVVKILNRSSIMVVPSRHLECFGLVALQAMQLGRPVVGAASGGMVEVIEDGKTGWIVPQENVEALTKKVGQLLRNPEIAKQFGEAGYHRAQNLFTLNKMTDAYEDLFRRLIFSERKLDFKKTVNFGND